MRISTSSFVLASLAISGTSLAAPTPPMPFDSPVPASPNPDEWLDAVRSPRIPRSPMLPAIRIAGQRRAAARSKRQEGSDQQGAPPDADAASASGLLGGLGDALSGVLHQVDDIAKGLPVIGGLGILSESGDGSSDPSAIQKRDASPSPSSPSTPSGVPPEQLDSVRQAVAALLLQQQQYDQAMSTLTATNGGLPVDPSTLQQRLQTLQSGQLPVNQSGLNSNVINSAGLGGISSALGGLPIAGSLLSNTVGGNSGLLSTIGGVTNGLPVVNGVLSNGGILNGLLGGVGSTVGTVLGSVTQAEDGLVDGILGGLSGSNGQQNVIGSILGGSLGQGATTSPLWPDIDGLYPHSILSAVPGAPPNTPIQNPAAFAFSSLAVDGAPDGSPLPVVPPPSPANSASSVPMEPDSPEPSTKSASRGESDESVPMLARRGDSGPIEGDIPDELDGFDPSIPDASYAPPLLSSSKRTASTEPLGSGPNDPRNDGAPESQRVLKEGLSSSYPKRMLRRHIRGASVAF